MTFTTRVLPHAEWHRLAGTELEPLAEVVDPVKMSVVVVEDATGAIVGCWGVLAFLHAEGVWIDPKYRGTGVVAKRLLRATLDEVRARGEHVAITGSNNASVDRLIKHIGGQEIPCKHYALVVK